MTRRRWDWEYRTANGLYAVRGSRLYRIFYGSVVSTEYASAADAIAAAYGYITP